MIQVSHLNKTYSNGLEVLRDVNVTIQKGEVISVIGPSGTGKSYRAQMIASERGINYIIDDGLLIKDNEVIAGTSAKKAPTKIETVRNALFSTEEQKKEIKKENIL